MKMSRAERAIKEVSEINKLFYELRKVGRRIDKKKRGLIVRESKAPYGNKKDGPN